MRSTRQLRHQADADRRRRGQVAAERAGEQHLLHVARLDAELLEQQRPAGRDGGLGELQLAHVALRQVDACRRGRCRVPVGAARRRVPGRSSSTGRRAPARARPAASSGTKRPDASSRPTLTSSATASTRPEPHRPMGVDVADDAELDVVAELDDLDRAVGRAHAAADRAALERRAGRGRGGQDPVAVAEHDLAVGADVDEQPQCACRGPCRSPGCRRRCRRRRRRRARGRSSRARRGCSVQAELGRRARPAARGRHDERRDAQRLGVDAAAPARSSWRCRRARPRRPRPGRRRPRRRPRRRARRASRARRVASRPERVRVHHGRADPGDDVAAERLLLVQPRARPPPACRSSGRAGSRRRWWCRGRRRSP